MNIQSDSRFDHSGHLTLRSIEPPRDSSGLTPSLPSGPPEQANVTKIDIKKILKDQKKAVSKKKLNAAHVLVLKIAQALRKVINKPSAAIELKQAEHLLAAKTHQIYRKFINKIDLDRVPLSKNDLIWMSQVLGYQGLTKKALHYVYRACKYSMARQAVFDLHHAIKTNDQKAIKKAFNRLPRSFQRSLAMLACQHHGHDFKESYGRKALLKDPSFLLTTKNDKGENILFQFIQLLGDLEDTCKDVVLLALKKPLESRDKYIAQDVATNVDESSPKLADNQGVKSKAAEARKIREALKSWFSPKKGGTEIYDTSVSEMEASLTNQMLKEPVTVAMVGAEYAGLMKQGGLAEAIEGMCQGILKQNPDNKVKLIFPYYNKIPANIQKELKPVEKPFYTSQGKEIPVFYAKIDGVECYFIKDDSFILDESNPSIYGPNDQEVQKRFIAFSSLAADVLHQMDKIDVIHLHDWHVAGVALKLAKEHEQEWKEGKIPPMVFTFHNNNRSAQGRFQAGAYAYHYEPVVKALIETGMAPSNANIFAETLNIADAVTTVSQTFAVESQLPLLGEGVSSVVRTAAKAGKLTGIVNGVNTTRWNPATDPGLVQWKDPNTGEAVDLSFGPTSPNAYAQKQKAKVELSKWISKHFPAGRVLKDTDGKPYEGPVFEFDPSKPTVCYIGRFDSYQKGLDKLEEAIESTLKNGGQFILMGSQEDPEATRILNELEKKYPKGVLFIRDYKDSNGRFHYQQGDPAAGLPGIGSVVRAAADIAFMPSRYEPCGLVQFESWLFGSLACGSNTGGLADTIVPMDQDPEHFNGYLFNRDGAPETRASAVIQKALHDWGKMNDEEKDALVKRMIAEGQTCYGWDTSRSGLTPSEKYRYVYHNAIQRVAKRQESELSRRFDFSEHLRKKFIPHQPVKNAELVLEEAYLHAYYQGHKSELEMQKLYNKLPEWLKAQVPPPYTKAVSDLHTKYGAHINEDGKFTFTLHAPKAKQVKVRFYDSDEHLVREVPLEKDKNGDWITPPLECTPGERYHYQIDDTIKIDPFSNSLIYPDKAHKTPYSTVPSGENYQWNDAAWMETRMKKAGEPQPMNIYEVHLASWMRQEDGSALNYRELAPKLVEHCKKMNFTQVQLMGILEHAFEQSMGYQVTNYFAPNSRMGSLEDFKYFVDYMHQNSIGVILDWAPAHFATNKYGLGDFDSSKLFEPSTKDQMFSKRNIWRMAWGTKMFDYSKPYVRAFLLSNAVYWMRDLHVDGLRVDAVRCMLDSENSDSVHLFLRQLNAVTHSQCKGGITIAEEYSGNEDVTKPIHKGGLGFDYTFNIGWMHHTLDFFSTPFSERKNKYHSLIKGIESFHSQRVVLGLSHDEVKSGKRALVNKIKGNDSQQFDNVKALLSLMVVTPGKKMNFMGNEIGSQADWTDYLGGNKEGFMQQELSQKSEGIQRMVTDINQVYKDEPALWEKDNNVSDLEWIEKDDPKREVIAFRRKGSKTAIACLHNVTDKPVEFFVPYNDRIKLEEIFNSDRQEYGGKGALNPVVHKVVDENNVQKGYKVIIPPMSTVMIRETPLKTPPPVAPRVKRRKLPNFRLPPVGAKISRAI